MTEIIHNTIDKTNNLSTELDRKLHNTKAMLYDELKDFRIVGEKCILRSIIPSDAHDLALAASNPQIYKKRLTRKKNGYDQKDAEMFVDYADSEHQKMQKRIFGIEYDGKIVGITSITKYEYPSDHVAFLGAWISVDYQGKGIYKDAITQMTKYSQEIFPDIIRLEGRLFASNKISPHVLEQLGYVREAVLKNRIKYNDEILDEIIYAKYLA